MWAVLHGIWANVKYSYVIQTHECPVGDMKYKQQCTLVSGMRFLRAMLTSSFKNFSYCSLMYLDMGSQLETQRGKISTMLHVESYVTVHETLKQQKKNQTRPNSLFVVRSEFETAWSKRSRKIVNFFCSVRLGQTQVKTQTFWRVTF